MNPGEWRLAAVMELARYLDSFSRARRFSEGKTLGRLNFRLRSKLTRSRATRVIVYFRKISDVSLLAKAKITRHVH